MMRRRSALAAFLILTIPLCLVSANISARGVSQCPDPGSGGEVVQDRTDFITESFEGTWPPSGWSVIHLGDNNTWVKSMARQRTGNYSAKVGYGPQGHPQDEYLVSPVLDFSSLANAYVEFFEDGNYWSEYGDHHYVGVSTTVPDDPAAFTFVAEWTPTNHTVAGFDSDAVRVDLSAYAGEPVVYVCFRYIGDWADDWWIDDVRIFEPYDHDMTILEVLPAEMSLNVPEILEPTVHVQNIGKNTEDFSVQMTISRSGVEVYSEVSTGNLASNEDSLFTFPTLVIEDGHYYQTQVSLTLAVDDDPANNEDVVYNYSYTHTHIPLAHMHTNAGCGPCAAAEPYVDAYVPLAEDSIALIRTHTWWPNSNDQLYRESQVQADTLINSYAADYTPHLWIDGVVDAMDQGATYAGALDAQREVLSPMELSMHWKPLSQKLLVVVNVLEPLRPDGDYRLLVAATESDFYYVGGNGHNIHDHAFRYMYPSLDGVEVPCEVGKYTYEIDTPLDPLEVDWEFDNVRFTIYVQEQHTWRIWQACSRRLTELTGNFTINPSVTTVQRGTEFTVDIDITPGLIEVVGCELIIDFDETVVRLDSITPGNWFDDFWPDAFFHDHTLDPPDPASEVHLTAALLNNASNAPGQLAVCHFYALAKDTTTLDFTLCKVRDEDNYELEFLHSLADTIIVEWTGTPVEDPQPAAALRLLGNAPNPFNPTTTISYEVPASGNWRLDIFNVGGRLVRTLIDEELTAGPHSVVWNGRDGSGNQLGSGLYFARVSGAAGNVTARMVLLK
ncbi:MAG: T9SS type A sorting domain-containing protein [bacterium]|nr:T9SS type A sorting domain-containing protein [bacterium]